MSDILSAGDENKPPQSFHHIYPCKQKTSINQNLKSVTTQAPLQAPVFQSSSYRHLFQKLPMKAWSPQAQINHLLLVILSISFLLFKSTIFHTFNHCSTNLVLPSNQGDFDAVLKENCYLIQKIDFSRSVKC